MRNYEAMAAYQREKALRPTARAIDVWSYVNSDEPMSFEQFTCSHEWVINEESDRCYCCYCLADGDA